jgi:hypothetical protein
MVWSIASATSSQSLGTMFRFRRHEPPDPGDPAPAVASDATERECRMLLERWRVSEQRVWRLWKAWLAADARDSAVRYGLLLRAMADEEKAAAAFELLARMVSANRAASA